MCVITPFTQSGAQTWGFTHSWQVLCHPSYIPILPLVPSSSAVPSHLSFCISDLSRTLYAAVADFKLFFTWSPKLWDHKLMPPSVAASVLLKWDHLFNILLSTYCSEGASHSGSGFHGSTPTPWDPFGEGTILNENLLRTNT